MTPPVLDPQARSTLGALADALIPPSGGMLSATQAGVADLWAEEVLAYRPDLAEGLTELLQDARDRPPAGVVRELRAAGTADWDLLVLVVAGGYLMNPEVADLLRSSGSQTRLVDPLDIDSSIAKGLLEPVIQRGPIYRPTPTTELIK